MFQLVRILTDTTEFAEVLNQIALEFLCRACCYSAL